MYEREGEGGKRKRWREGGGGEKGEEEEDKQRDEEGERTSFPVASQYEQILVALTLFLPVPRVGTGMKKTHYTKLGDSPCFLLLLLLWTVCGGGTWAYLFATFVMSGFRSQVVPFFCVTSSSPSNYAP